MGAAGAFGSKWPAAAADFDLALAEQVKAAVKTIAAGGVQGQKPQSHSEKSGYSGFLE